MSKNLVIVESPAKAKTIEGYLGKDFTVRSSFGHIRDLPERDLSIDVEHDFEPKYVVPADKKKLVQELKSLAKSAETVWLATDEDREGEAISWHLFEALGLDEKHTKRITFNEITKTAILKAIENPRSINRKLVDAQQARRVLDRLVGYELSPVLWKKVKPSLSAGRVQSVAVRLIVEREREIQDFKAEAAFRVVGEFGFGKDKFKAELAKRFKTMEEAQAFLNDCLSSSFAVNSLEKKPGKRTPAAPFTTSTLQQEASRKLGFSVNRTMSVAQGLYEAGKISYMRTDSVNLSETAIEQAKSAIEKEFGPQYAHPRRFATKSKGAQEAHEAIRPTDMLLRNVGMDAAAQKLYELIWKRTLASQMADAQIEKTVIKVGISGNPLEFVATGEVIRFDGFLKLYLEGTDDENEEGDGAEGKLPDVKKGDPLDCKQITATERFSHHPPRYTEASLVKKLEELGIGRPSTYAPTISNIVKRQYVEKLEKEGKERKYRELVVKAGAINAVEKTEITGAEKGKLSPTDIGAVVTDFLSEHFSRIMDYNFTARVEKEFDDIAEGELEWTRMLEGFYRPFSKNIQETLQTSSRAKGERQLGLDPASGKPVVAKIGRYGPLVQIGDVNDPEKPRFAPLNKDQSIATITLEEALKLFELPRLLGKSGAEEVLVNTGKYGPYVKLGKTYASLGKEDNPMSITLERALQLIAEKESKDQNKTIKTFADRADVQLLRGPYGPYLKIGKTNYRLPKGTEAESLSLDECLAIAEKSGPSKPKKKRS
jgi:DNA topoisomerase-1